MGAEDPRAVELDQTLADLMEREEALTHDHYVDGIMSAEAYRVTMTAIKRKRESVERERAKLNVDSTHFQLTRGQLLTVSGPPVSLADAEPEDVEFWRDVVQTVFEKVVIKAHWHGRRFSADRVELVPRPEYPDAVQPWYAWDIPSMTPEQRIAVAMS
jgi:hypothetical protein